MYFAQFDPRPVGKEANEKILQNAGDGVLGIEVTVPASCSLGNLDHHGPEDNAQTPSASEQALTYEIPPAAATLVTVRCDADSVTAMAILASRAEGRPVDEGIVRAVGRFDRLGPAEGRPSDEVIAINRVAADFKRSLAERVEWVQEVLAGEGNPDEIAELVAQLDAEFEAARAASELRLEANGRIAVVVSTHRFATNLGYESAPVVVAMNPEMPVDFRDSSKGTYKKFTVCRYDSHTPCDLPAALAELRETESGWGGRGDIFGSPQGVSSKITIEQVVEVVAKHLK